MSTIVVKRPPRRPEPSWPSGELVLTAPPELPGDARRHVTRMFMILPMLAGSAATATISSRVGGGGPRAIHLALPVCPAFELAAELAKMQVSGHVVVRSRPL